MRHFKIYPRRDRDENSDKLYEAVTDYYIVRDRFFPAPAVNLHLHTNVTLLLTNLHAFTDD